MRSNRRLELSITASTGRNYVPYVRRHLLSAAVMAGSKLRELSVALVGDKRMSGLHARFMQIAGPTDVMSFPLEVDGRGNVIGGEVVICVSEARRQARIMGTAVKHELLLYAIHGLLHLSGEDDKTKEDFRRMHAKEDNILRRLGIGRVFSPRGAE